MATDDIHIIRTCIDGQELFVDANDPDTMIKLSTFFPGALDVCPSTRKATRFNGVMDSLLVYNATLEIGKSGFTTDGVISVRQGTMIVAPRGVARTLDLDEMRKALCEPSLFSWADGNCPKKLRYKSNTYDDIPPRLVDVSAFVLACKACVVCTAKGICTFGGNLTYPHTCVFAAADCSNIEIVSDKIGVHEFVAYAKERSTITVQEKIVCKILHSRASQDSNINFISSFEARKWIIEGPAVFTASKKHESVCVYTSRDWSDGTVEFVLPKTTQNTKTPEACTPPATKSVISPKHPTRSSSNRDVLSHVPKEEDYDGGWVKVGRTKPTKSKHH